MKGYFRRLANHPGVFPAFGLTIMGAIAGREGGARGMVAGAMAMSIFWLPVMLTARRP